LIRARTSARAYSPRIPRRSLIVPASSVKFPVLELATRSSTSPSSTRSRPTRSRLSTPPSVRGIDPARAKRSRSRDSEFSAGSRDSDGTRNQVFSTLIATAMARSVREQVRICTARGELIRSNEHLQSRWRARLVI